MTVVEAVLAALLIAGGLRSLVVWSGRTFVGGDLVDHLLYALHLTGRVGVWFALAGFFILAATITMGGRPSELGRFRWYALVPIVLAATQLLAGYALARRGARD